MKSITASLGRLLDSADLFADEEDEDLSLFRFPPLPPFATALAAANGGLSSPGSTPIFSAAAWKALDASACFLCAASFLALIVLDRIAGDTP